MFIKPLGVPFPYLTKALMWPSPLFSFASSDTPKTQHVLYPGESSLIKGASEKRERDFCAGRYCAHQVLGRLGYEGIPVLKDINGAPTWPMNIVGSISHSGEVAIAVAAYTEHIRSLGVDIQEHGKPFPRDVLYSFFRSEEINAILKVQPTLISYHAYAIFSAKESVLKCCYTAFGYLLEFTDISIEMDLAGGNFSVRIPQHSIGEGFCNRNRLLSGQVSIDDSYIYTGIWLKREHSSK
ncbi:MAG TPA: 4'-phosphopantetheinyl transferase superfamily protein [Nitrosospira sp.]|jgi:4'-phosphopantetheinyl transferase EntD|nr:4'-phosphopantetheinyl transferase superfamily protein [Nitrosospira sp.]